MSDDNLEQEHKPVSNHEFAETPFGGSLGRTRQEPEPAQTQQTDQPAPAAPATDQEEHKGPADQAAQEPAKAPADSAATEAPVDYSDTFKGLSVGDVVDGVVVHIDREGVLVDVGTKSEGIIRPGEIARDQSLSPEDVVSVGEKIKVYVVEPEGHDGGPILSKKRADFENAWDRVEKAFAEKSVLRAMVTDRVKGGLVVDLGIRGFVPASHVGSGKLKNLDKFIGQSMPFKVIEVDRERRKVVLSNRLAVEEEREAQKKETLATLKEGQIRSGIVRRITDYGAFIDLGGVDGLLHISEMSWTRINHPSEAVKVGQKLQVMVLKLNLEQGRVSLGLRQILPDPWQEIKRIHSVGDVVEGTVTRIVPFGAFVQVEGGVEGIIPTPELAARRTNNPEEVVQVGQRVEVKIIDLRPDERRLTLSIRQLHADREKAREDAEYRDFAQSKLEDKTTIGDLIGEQLGEFALHEPEGEKVTRKRARARAKKKEDRRAAEEMAEAEELAMEDEIDLAPEPTMPEEDGSDEQTDKPVQPESEPEVEDKSEAELGAEAESDSQAPEDEVAETVQRAEAEPEKNGEQNETEE